MGNRATVIFTDKDEKEVGPAVYLHWNGGPESVYAFLDELDRRKVRSDVDYATARFVHVVGDFFDQDEASGLSLGVNNGPKAITPEALRRHDPGDNGIYVIARNGDGKPHIRRFGSVRCDGPLIEKTAEQVEQEREAAYRNPYNTPVNGDDALADVFKRLRPKIEYV